MPIHNPEKDKHSAPITVADEATRKTTGTYAHPVVKQPGLTRVIQTDLPGILWLLVATDVTADASWIGMPYTVDPDGTVMVNMELANVEGTVPDQSILAEYSGVPTLGDGAASAGQAWWVPPKPAGYFTGMCNGAAALTITVKHDGGESASGVCWSINGGAPTYVAGAAGASCACTLTDMNGSPYTFAIWPATSATSGIKGNLTSVAGTSGELFYVDPSGLTSMTQLSFGTKQVTRNTFLDLRGMTSLATLSLAAGAGNASNLTILDVSEMAASTYIQIDGMTNLTEVRGMTGLTSISSPVFANCARLAALDFTGVDLTSDFIGNALPSLTSLLGLAAQTNIAQSTITGTGITELDYSDNPTTQYLFAQNNPSLASIDISGCTGMQTCHLNNNALTEVIATGFNGAAYSSSSTSTAYGMNLANNLLTTDAVFDMLTQMASSLLAGSMIDLRGNPCDGGASLTDGVLHTGADTEALAATKNYTLILT